MEFGLLNEISDEKKTWDNKLFVTTDIDWACDEVIEYVFNFFKELNVKVTWFATHETKWNTLINNNPNHLIGCHPNFNPLLTGSDPNQNAENILMDLLKVIPKTNLVRSHSTAQSSPLLDLFLKHDLTIESNIFLPIDSGIISQPFRHFNGTLRVPYIWSDDVHFLYKWNHKEAIEKIKNYAGARVIDCHPIHIFLNTDDPKRYTDARPYLKDFKMLEKFVNEKDYGVRDFLKELFSK